GKRFNVNLSLYNSYSSATGYYRGVNPLSYALNTSRILEPTSFYPFAAISGQNINLSKPVTFNILHEINHSSNTTNILSSSVNLNLDYQILKSLTFRNSSSFILDNADGFAYTDEYTFLISSIRGWDWMEAPTIAQVQNSSLPSGGLADMNNSRS